MPHELSVSGGKLLAFALALALLALGGCRSGTPRGPAGQSVGVCRVAEVVDGDTLVVRCDGKRERVRLHAIDAPERKQPYGAKATALLEELVLGEVVEVRRTGKRSHRRTVAAVRFEGPGCAPGVRCADLGTRMIELGAAWWFERFAPEQPRADAHRACVAECAARGARVGLWAAEEPTPPWGFRRTAKDGRASSGAADAEPPPCPRRCERYRP